MTPVVTEAFNNGIPVILLTRKILNEQYTAFIGADDNQIARDAARYLADLLNGQGKVVMLEGVATASTAIQRTQGFLAEIKNYPGIQVVARSVANYRRNTAIKEMDKIISAGIHFDAVFSHSDSMASGARMAMKMAGIDPKTKKIVAIDYIPEAKRAIINGEQSASYTYPTAGKQGAETILRLIHGLAIEKNQTVPFVRVTKENVLQVDTIFD